MEEIKKKPTIEIINEMNHLDDEIWSKIIRYNKLVEEITTRFPQIKNNEEFKPKILCKKVERR